MADAFQSHRFLFLSGSLLSLLGWTFMFFSSFFRLRTLRDAATCQCGDPAPTTLSFQEVRTPTQNPGPTGNLLARAHVGILLSAGHICGGYSVQFWLHLFLQVGPPDAVELIGGPLG